ncbi:uncharacterized protein DDB_G0271670 [Sorghum bicolor]|uniref:DUF4378 domain-containing protein n=1 Tax=Sorghum bicolor TaxID=4558 RepID=C5X0Z8_SORBI|nr:uncharacterized protein DDB_G0271670 [Sorghum bicolor]EER95633.1 hypothetical protein SORBI_3001G531000 [Sorghum bicolor]|eukprot:XP_002468635.1 uncharacterized protein DDB_G0271670 [Sorghum bicolor]
MAARGVQAPRRPVTLRDFLELGCDSSSDGFRSYPRRLPFVPDADDSVLQHLQQQQAAPPAPRAEAAAAQLLRRSPSRSPSSLSLSLFSLPGSVSGHGSGLGALARISSLSRTFSRRIKEGFWRRRDDGDDEEAAYFDDRDSCGFPSPLVSSCSASDSDESEYGAESEADVTTTTEETTPASERDKATASTSSSSSSSSSSRSADHDRTDDAAAADGKKVQELADGDSAVGRKKLMEASMVEDKQQLSPVSVLDFPFDDDDGEEGSDAGTCSSPAFQFQRCTPPDVQRTKKQTRLLHEIRRYDGGGVAQGIDPLDLDARFTAATSESGESADASTRLATTTTSSSSTDSSSTSETTATRHDDDETEHQSAERSPSPSPDHQAEQEEPDDEYRLLARLLEHDAAAAACLDDEVSRVLVLDFFAEGADHLIRSAAGSEALLGAAAEWLRGAGPRWGIGDVVLSGKSALDDMERSRRWMCVGEEQRDVGADVEGAVVDALLDELVMEMAVLPWWPRPRGDRAVDAPELGCARSLTEC